MIDPGYLQYTKLCAVENSVVLNKRNHLLEYKKNKNGHRIGVVLAYRAVDGQVYIGFSLYNKKEKRPFSKHVGINRAVRTAYPFNEFTINAKNGTAAWDAVPSSLFDDVRKMIHRAVRYFK